MGGTVVRSSSLRSSLVVGLFLAALAGVPVASAVPGGTPPPPTLKAALQEAAEVARTIEPYGLYDLVLLEDGRHGLMQPDGTLFKVYDDYGAVTLNGRRIDSLSEPAAWSGPGVYLVQMIGPVKPEWREALGAKGTILDFAAPFTFLMWLDSDVLSETRSVPWVRGIAAYTADLKLGTTFRGHLDDPESSLAAMIYDPQRLVDPRDLAYLVGGTWEFSYPVQHYTKVKIDHADPAYLGLLLGLPFVVYVERWTPAEIEGEDSKQIVAGNLNANKKALYDYQAWLLSLGIDGTGVVVGHIDTGVYDKHLDFETRVSGPAYGADSNGHGTHTMSTILGAPIGGDPDGDKFLDGMGMAPKATGVAYQLSGSNKALLFEQMSKAGAHVSSNSWNIGSNGADYGADEKEYDGYVIDADPTTTGAQPLTIFFSAGNAGASGLTRPHAAKDIISVCNAHSNHTTGANIENVATSSSVGPTADGRWKPEICAPGSDIIAALSGSTGGYTKKTGTSMSCPHAAGAGALITQWYEKTYGVKPQSSMVKAMLVNGAQDMVGGNAGDIPNKFEGWGRIVLKNTFAKSTGGAMTHIDDKELATGQEFTLTASAADAAKPLKITIAWVDPPGTAGCTICVVNDLDLVVDGSGGTYYGNNFASSWSQAGGAASPKDNLENVFIQNPTGSYTIHIKGTNVAQGPQKFSLVISNAGASAAGLSFDTPKSGDAFKGGDPVNVAWKSTGQFQPNSLSVAFSKDNGASWDPPFATAQPLNGSASWTAPSIDTKDGVLRGIAKDMANKDVEVRSGRFSVDSTPPTATVQAMPKVTMAKDFDIVYQATDAVSGIAEVEIFYRVEGGAYASAGKPVSSPYNFSAPREGLFEFYASAVDKAGHQEAAPASPEANTLVDLTPPSLISSVPANGAKDVALNPKVELVFSEPMDQPSVAAGLAVSPAATKGTLTWDQGGARLSFSLGPLKFATKYDITVNGTDRAGRPLGAKSVKFDTLAIPPNPSTIQGRVFDVQNQVGLAGATVRAVWEGSEFKRVTTNGTGGFVIDKLPSGAFVVFAEKAAFEPQNRSLILAEGVVETLDFYLTPPGKPAGTLKGVVKDAGGSPLEGATVTVGKAKAKTAADGLFRFELLAGSYDALATKAGYIDAKESATVDAGKETEVTLTLQQKPSTDILSMSVAGIPLLMLIIALVVALIAGVVALRVVKRTGGAKCQFCSTKIPKGVYACPVCGAATGPSFQPEGQMGYGPYDQGPPPPIIPPQG